MAGFEAQLRHPRKLSDKVEAPLFRLGGLAVGNGFTGGPVCDEVADVSILRADHSQGMAVGNGSTGGAVWHVGRGGLAL